MLAWCIIFMSFRNQTRWRHPLFVITGSLGQTPMNGLISIWSNVSLTYFWKSAAFQSHSVSRQWKPLPDIIIPGLLRWSTLAPIDLPETNVVIKSIDIVYKLSQPHRYTYKLFWNVQDITHCDTQFISVRS